MTRTKIVATVGPACSDPATLGAIIDEGVDLLRINFSHGTVDDHGKVLGRIREHCERTGAIVAVLGDLCGPKIRVGELADGTGVIEAPRGTLFHHYEINDLGIVEKASLIVSTTNNNQAMNESIRRVANQYLDGNRLTEALLNQVEVAIRAYDPCLSCATHKLDGSIAVKLEIRDASGKVIDTLANW